MTAAGSSAGEARQVAARFGVTGARQHAAGLRHEREDVPGLPQVFGTGGRSDRRLDGVRAVVGRDAGRDAFGRLDRQREVGALVGVGVADHQRQAQLAAAVAGQRQADQAAAVAGHEVDVFGTHFRRGHHQVALVLAVLVVHDHDHPALSDVVEDLVDGI